MPDIYSNLPPEVVLQQQQLNRQQKMAEMLLAQGAQPQAAGQMVSGRYVPNSFFQNLQPVANMLVGAYMAKKGDEKALDLAEQLRKGRAEAEKEILKNLTPSVELTEMAGPAYLGQIPVSARTVPPNLAKAAEIIKTNAYGAGKEFLPQITKNLIPELPTSVREYQYGVENPEFFAQQMAQRKASAPNMTAITNVQAFEPFKSKAQGQMGEVLIKNFETLQNIPTAIRTLDRAAELAPQSFAGSFGEQKLELAKFFNNNLGTNINPSKVANTEELRSALFTNVMENLKKLDASPSQEQQRVLQQSMGSLATDPSALPRVINTYKQILVDKAESHNKKVAQAESGPAKMEFPFDIRIPLTGGLPSQSDIDAEIARRRGGR